MGQSLLNKLFPDHLSFAEKALILKSAPYNLEVRDHGQLYNVMYTSKTPCTNEFPESKHLVGSVFEKANDKLIGYGFDRTEELIFDPQNAENLLKRIDNDFLKTAKVFAYEEGTKITVYYFENIWYVSTNRMIDASKAFWNSPNSFRAQFMNICRDLHPDIAVQIEQNTLEGPLKEGFSYAIIMMSPEHRSISPYKPSKLLHSATTNLKTFTEVTENIGMPTPKQINIDNVDSLVRALKNLEYWMPGFIISGDKRFKVLTESYRYVKELAGNDPDIRRHYFQIRRHTRAKSDFLRFYPYYRSLANTIEKDLWSAAKVLHTIYISHFIKHEKLTPLDKPIFVALMQLHSEWKTSRRKRTLQLVYDYVNGLSPILQSILIHTTKRYEWDQNSNTQDCSF